MKHRRNLELPQNRVLSTLMSGHSSTVNEGQPFTLKSSVEFASRSKQIFEGLGTSESSPRQNDLEDVGSKEDVFKRPKTFAPIPRRRRDFRRLKRLPGYAISPEKWKKYSLADVPEHTEESNTNIAMDFLRKMKQRDQRSSEAASTFRKPSSRPSAQSRSGKLVMPECTVGFRPKTEIKKKDKAKRKEKKKEISLSHLTESMDDT